MLHAKIPDGFFDYGDSGLDGDACALILEKMDDDVCARFLGAPEVGYQFCETTAAHEIRTYQHIEPFLKFVIRDPRERYDACCHYKAMITLHDISDIIREVLVGSTETDPALKEIWPQRVRQYDLKVTSFVYRLALFSNAQKIPEFFGQVIDEMREELLDKEKIGLGLPLNEALDFCASAVKLVEENDHHYRSFRLWNSPEILEKTEKMMQYYNEIELTSSFAGLQSQIHEKCDGTDYACSISTHKNMHNLMPTHYHMRGVTMDRLNSRYEKNLERLFSEADNNSEKLALAALTTQYCYRVSQMVYSLGKPYICLHDVSNEPGYEHEHTVHQQFAQQQEKLFQTKSDTGIIERKALVDLYGNAIEDLANKGVCRLPKEGGTLASSEQHRKLELDQESFALAKDLLQSFAIS